MYWKQITFRKNLFETYASDVERNLYFDIVGYYILNLIDVNWNFVSNERCDGINTVAAYYGNLLCLIKLFSFFVKIYGAVLLL